MGLHDKEVQRILTLSEINEPCFRAFTEEASHCMQKFEPGKILAETD